MKLFNATDNILFKIIYVVDTLYIKNILINKIENNFQQYTKDHAFDIGSKITFKF